MKVFFYGFGNLTQKSRFIFKLIRVDFYLLLFTFVLMDQFLQGNVPLVKQMPKYGKNYVDVDLVPSKM